MATHVPRAKDEIVFTTVDEISRPSTARRRSRFEVPRATAIAALLGALDAQLVLLKGPAGIGKSTLVRQLDDELKQRSRLGVDLVDLADAELSDGDLQEVIRSRRPALRRVVILDHYRDGIAGLSTSHIVQALRADPWLTIVVATRHLTGLEDPSTALTIDTWLLPPSLFMLDAAETADVLLRNEVSTSADAVEIIARETEGWPALVQLAAARSRVERLALRTPADARLVVDYAARTFTDLLLSAMPFELTDEIRLTAIAPLLTIPIMEALGIGSQKTTAPDLFRVLQDAGIVWPSATRAALVTTVQRRWRAEVSVSRPGEVMRARAALLAHLLDVDEPLSAATVAVDAGDTASLVDILRDHAPAMRASDVEAFGRLLAVVRDGAPTGPREIALLLTLDPASICVPDLFDRVPRALAVMGSRAGDVESLLLRLPLLRAAGRFALAHEAARELERVLRSGGSPPVQRYAGWFQVGMTQLSMARTREAAIAFRSALRDAVDGAGRTQAGGALALVAAIEGDVTRAVAELRAITSATSDEWMVSPWGAVASLASAFVDIEHGDAPSALAAVERLRDSSSLAELWPLAASVGGCALLMSGAPAEALALVHGMVARLRHVPVCHFFSAQLVSTRTRIMIGLRQAGRATALFEGAMAHSALTAAGIGVAHLFAGRAHDAYVATVTWGMQRESTPRVTVECLVVNAVAGLRLGHRDAARRAAQRAESLSRRHGLWSPWSLVPRADRADLHGLLSPDTVEILRARPLFFEEPVEVPRLTQREQIVLEHLAPPATIAQIAARLVVSPNTVKTQLRALYRKLGVTDRAAAIRAAHSWGLLDADVVTGTSARPADRDRRAPFARLDARSRGSS